MKDIKRRNTSHYLFATAGLDGVVIWDLDPYSGELLPLKLTGDVRATINRKVLDVSFSDDKEYLYGATTSGEFIVASMRQQKIVYAVPATKMSVNAIVSFKEIVIIGCGDKSIKIYTHNGDFVKEVVVDGAVVNLSSSADNMEVRPSTVYTS